MCDFCGSLFSGNVTQATVRACNKGKWSTVDLQRCPGLKKCSHPCPFIGWLVCQQDYTETTRWTSMKLEWRIILSPEQTPSPLRERERYRNYFILFFFFSIARFLAIFFNFSGNNAWIPWRTQSGVFRWLMSMSELVEVCALLSNHNIYPIAQLYLSSLGSAFFSRSLSSFVHPLIRFWQMLCCSNAFESFQKKKKNLWGESIERVQMKKWAGFYAEHSGTSEPLPVCSSSWC